MLTRFPSYLPSPDTSVWHLGPIPLRAYALFIIAGIFFSIWLGDKRYQSYGGRAGTIADLAVWAVPFGVIGGRIYHVVTTWEAYFGPTGTPVNALKIWEGGLGIWGAITLGSLGVWIGIRRQHIAAGPVFDALAPGVVVAQAIGRLGNWFNNELYGAPTTLPWGLRVHEWDQAAGRAVVDAAGNPIYLPGAYHPTFLYELLWNLGVFVVLLWAERRFRLGHGQVALLYIALYTLGRFWIENLRIDQAHLVGGVRLNVWTSLFVFTAAVLALIWSRRRYGAGRDVVLQDTTG